METKLNEIVIRLQEAHREGLVSVILSGPAIAAQGNSPAEDYYLLVVTESLALEDLKRMNSALKWWETSGFPRATCFTRKEFRTSLDVFPIEFREMQRSYRLLFGEDLFAGVAVSKTNLRLLTEYELRGKFLRLRALYLPSSDDSQRLCRLMTDSVVSFAQYLRVVPELFGEEPPLSRLGVIRRTGELLNVDPSPVVRVLRMRDDSGSLFGIEVQDLFESYLNCLDEIIEAVDRI